MKQTLSTIVHRVVVRELSVVIHVRCWTMCVLNIAWLFPKHHVCIHTIEMFFSIDEIVFILISAPVAILEVLKSLPLHYKVHPINMGYVRVLFCLVMAWYLPVALNISKVFSLNYGTIAAVQVKLPYVPHSENSMSKSISVNTIAIMSITAVSWWTEVVFQGCVLSLIFFRTIYQKVRTQKCWPFIFV